MQQVGETPQLFPVLWGIGLYHVTRAEYQLGREQGEKLLALARTIQDPALLVEAHYLLAHSTFWPGELRAAHEHAEQALLFYDLEKQRAHIARYGQDSIVHCLVAGAPALWLLGYPAQALERIKQARAFAQETALPYGVASALGGMAFVHQFRREEHATQEQSEAVLGLSTEQGFPYWLILGTLLRGWALTQQGETEEGISSMREGLSAMEAAEGVLGISHFLGLLASVYQKEGQGEEGLATVAKALAFVERTEERFYEAELHRLQGELLLSNDERGMMNDERKTERETAAHTRIQEVEQCFHKAINVARQQQAKSWELRAATSLARLWQHQGKQDEAHDLLAPVYRWFTEGFDTADLKDAKALLDALEEVR